MPLPLIAGMGIGKLAALMGLGTGFDLLGGWLGGDDNPTESFKGRRAANGQSIDPGNVYGEGLAALRGLMPSMQNRMNNPVQLRGSYVQNVPGLSGGDPLSSGPRLRFQESLGGSDDFADAAEIFKMFGFGEQAGPMPPVVSQGLGRAVPNYTRRGSRG